MPVGYDVFDLFLTWIRFFLLLSSKLKNYVQDYSHFKQSHLVHFHLISVCFAISGVANVSDIIKHHCLHMHCI